MCVYINEHMHIQESLLVQTSMYTYAHVYRCLPANTPVHLPTCPQCTHPTHPHTWHQQIPDKTTHLAPADTRQNHTHGTSRYQTKPHTWHQQIPDKTTHMAPADTRQNHTPGTSRYQTKPHTWHQQIPQLGQQQRDDAGRWVGHRLGAAPVCGIQVLAPRRQDDLSTVVGAHQRQSHAAQL